MAPGRITVTLARAIAVLVLAGFAGVVAVRAQPVEPPRDPQSPANAASSADATVAPGAVSEAATTVAPHPLPPEAPPTGVPATAHPATVTSITDGDTLRVDTGNGNEPVRLLELDTPEVTGDCGATEATDALGTLAPVGSRLWMEADVEDRDRYGRLLRYLWRDDGTMINQVLVRQGWARATLYPPNERYWPAMQRAEQRARARNAGLWERCGWSATPDDTPAPLAPEPTTCDPNYSGCVPRHPPDVDCSRVDGPVTVLGSDPHHLDGEGDGRACEPPQS